MRLRFFFRLLLSSSSCCYGKVDGQSNAVSVLEQLFLPLRCISLQGSYQKPPVQTDKQELSTPPPSIPSPKSEHKYSIFGKKQPSRKLLFQKSIYEYLTNTPLPRKNATIYVPPPPENVDNTLLESSDDTAEQT